MAVCKHCSAPLPANTNRCRYCGVRNDIDLNDKRDYSIVSQPLQHLCPHCAIPLQTVDLALAGPFLIERCTMCFGLFFNPGQIETLLASAVSGVFQVNIEQLDAINRDRFQSDARVKYVKCPICQVLMNRNAYGYRSGVIIDCCKQHGVWLDSGEITHLLEWKKAGGQLLQQRQQLASQDRASRPTPPPLHADAEDADLSVFHAALSVIDQLFES